MIWDNSVFHLCKGDCRNNLEALYGHSYNKDWTIAMEEDMLSF